MDLPSPSPGNKVQNVHVDVLAEYTYSSSTANVNEIVDIVAVPGWTTNGLASPWLANNGLSWLGDPAMLPFWAPTARIMHVEYTGLVEDHRRSLQAVSSLAKQLLHCLVQIREDCRSRPLIFLGHSLGGLIIQKAVLLSKLHDGAYPMLAASLAGIVFLGTPQRPLQHATQAHILGHILAGKDGTRQVPDSTLDKDSEMLLELSSDFARSAMVNHVPVFCFCEETLHDPTGEGRALSLVDISVGAIDGFPSATLGADHFSMARYATPDDVDYMRVRDQLVKFTQCAAGVVAERQQDSAADVERCINALFVTDPSDDMDLIEHNNGPVFEGSTEWLYQNANFKQWMASRDHDLLWLSGGPGKGKTMLAISMVKHLTALTRSNGTATSDLLSHFFCDNKDDRRNSALAVLRGLIYQILRSRPDLSSKFRSLYKREGNHLFRSPTALQSLWRSLKEIFADPRVKRVYIIVDAIDELESDALDDLLKLLCGLKDAAGVEGKEGSQVKWLVTSRAETTISRALSSFPAISLEDNSSQVQDAVSVFVNERVNELRKLKGYSDALAELVRKTLLDKSGGTFLYVSMACRALSQPNVRLINTKAALQAFPRGLDLLYERMIREIYTTGDEELVTYAKAILRAMVLAVRPLTVQELAVAARLPEEHHSDIDMLYEYAGLCGSVVNRRGNKVHLVHESIKQYLQDLGDIFPEPPAAYHAELAEDFFSRLNNQIPPIDFDDDHQRAYTSLFWMYHAKQGDGEVSWDKHLDAPLLSSKCGQLRKRWFDYYWSQNHYTWDKQPCSLTPLHLAAYGGISLLVKALVNRGDAINEVDSNGYTPLMWAAKNGHLDATKMFLSLGADCKRDSPDGLTALSWASINGYHRVVEELLAAGASASGVDKMGRTALHYVAGHGNIKTLCLLIDAGAELNVKDVGQQTALQRAASCADLASIKILVKHGADIRVKSKEGHTLLHFAARANYLDLVDFWLKLSDDRETQDHQSWTPLMHAAWYGNDRAAARLIQNKVKVEARARDGNTALHLATLANMVSAVKVLLHEGKASPNCVCNHEETPLHQAAWRGNVAICRLLLEAGADANLKSHSGLTALHQAAANGHEVVAKLLLEWGTDPNVVDAAKHTPGSLAQDNQHHTLAKYLRSLEIIGGDDELGSTLTRTPADCDPLDPAICELLGIPPESGFSRPYGKQGFSKPTQVTALVNGKEQKYFVKSGPIKEMFESEYHALNALRNTVPSICPLTFGHGRLANSKGYFLLMEWVDMAAKHENTVQTKSNLSLPQKLAKLHTTPAPVPDGHSHPMFGFPWTTYCGSTRQENSWRSSWAKFYAENRLLAMLKLIDESHGTDQELRTGVESIVRVVVPRLLGNGHLGGRRGVKPVLVHGDLWMGNRAVGRHESWGGSEEVVFDPSACYAHSEYEVGIMLMFGGFSAGFLHEYHQLVPKTEPRHEYEDRIKLYQLYHYLNHYLIFQGGYKDNCLDIVRFLSDKYIASEGGGGLTS